MAPKTKTDRGAILGAALQLVREEGMDALNARALANRMGISTQPIFSQFSGMGELAAEVRKAAAEEYRERIGRAMRADPEHAYRASGMAYIAFAREEPQLFRDLFMRDRTGEQEEENKELTDMAELLRARLGLSREDATFFHLEMWVVVHGVATMIATSFLVWNEETISRILTDLYNGLRCRYEKE